MRRRIVASAARRVGVLTAAEQLQHGLRRLIGDRQRLDAQLLLRLQRLEPGAFFREVGVDKIADAVG